MYFWIYGLRKISLNKCLRNTVSQENSASGKVNGNKRCENPDDTTFSMIIDHREGNWAGKNLSYWNAKCEKCLLRHWLRVRSIPFVIETI